jgi:hypothetical protein
VKHKSPIPRVHPLILSLTWAINESEEIPNKIPNVVFISENDPGTLGNRYYTSPKNFPPLDEHLYGQSLPGDQQPLIASSTLADDCPECTLSEPQDYTKGAGNATKLTVVLPGKGKRQRHASSGAVQSDYLISTAIYKCI